MSDERDETRRLPPSDDTSAGSDDLPGKGETPSGADDALPRETFPERREFSPREGDETLAGHGDFPPRGSDETLAGHGDFPPREGDETLAGHGELFPRAADETVAGGGGFPPRGSGETLVEHGDLPPYEAGDTLPAGDTPTVTTRPDATSVMPPATDDWAPSRANPVWSGRAEVRAPQADRAGYDTDWSSGPPSPPVQRDRWWMPIVVGIVVLVLLAVLGWAIFLIVQNVDRREAPAPSATTAATTATTAGEATTAPTTMPTTATTTTPTTAPSTIVPPTTAVTVPALRGLALADAQAALGRTGLPYRLIYRTSDAPPDTVIDSDPAEGQEVPPDTAVTLVVARGATTPSTGTATTTAGPTRTGVGGN